MSLPTYFFALSDDGVVNLSHGLAAITSARNRRTSARRRSAAKRLIAVLATGAGLIVASLMTGCERSPSGALQRTIPSGSPPATPAFATNALRTAGDTDRGAGSPATSMRLGSSTPTSETLAATGDVGEGCSLAGSVTVERISDEHFEITRHEVERIAAILQEQSKTADRRLALTHTENGLPGLHVQAVGPQAACGLSSGDIVISINGISVANRSDLAKNRPRLLTAEKLELLIERERRSHRLKYVVRES